eukprot:COSAG02_NODE_67390_length_253_cov_0.662338_1_plen_33_part_01
MMQGKSKIEINVGEIQGAISTLKSTGHDNLFRT